MPDKILLNNSEYHINETSLPCLITYGEKSGGSHFTISMVADLFLNGSKILFLTAYPMAKDNFLKQINDQSKTAYITDVNQLPSDAQAIIIESGNENLFLEALNKIDDLSDRVILIKNMEVFSQAVFDVCLNHKKIILSGDLDKTTAKEQISSIDFGSTVIFTNPEMKLKVEATDLEKYTGYLWQNGKEGVVKVEISA